MSWYIEEQSPVYLDYNATTPIDPEVKKSIIESLDLWANPSSDTPEATEAHHAIERAREQVGTLLHVSKDQVYFTSGGTESNTWVIHSALEEFRRSGRKGKAHILTSIIDHPSIVMPLKRMSERGEVDVSFCPIDPSSGAVDLDQLQSSICDRTCLVTVMLANNETGVIQPIAEISDIVREAGDNFGCKIFMHTDSTQAIGKIDVNMEHLKVDAVTVGGHKIYGPRNGALVIRSKHTVTLHPLLSGCGQEMGKRAGTENTPMIVGLGKACEIAGSNSETFQRDMREIRDYFEKQLESLLPEHSLVHFSASPRLPNTSSVAFPKYPDSSADLLAKCKSFKASTAAAGHCKEKSGSPILIASGISNELAARTVRFSFGRNNTREEVDRVVNELKAMCFFSKFGSSLMGVLNKGAVPGF